MMTSPYPKNKREWKAATASLIDRHPLERQEIASFVHAAWNALFNSSIGNHRLIIGTHIFPKPQIVGALLHELIPAEVVAAYPTAWRREQQKTTKILSLLMMTPFQLN